MTKKSLIVKEIKKKKLANKFYTKREKLKKIIKSCKYSNLEKFNANAKLQSLPKNSSFIRSRNRCFITGRPRGYIRRFGLSRIKFREMALLGNIPGVKKYSW